MLKIRLIGIAIAGLTVFTSTGNAQDREAAERQPGDVLRAREAGFVSWITPRIRVALQHSSKNISERYGLPETAAVTLYQALSEVADSALDDNDAVETIGNQARLGNSGVLLIAVLSRSEGEDALGRFLEEKQVEDCLTFIRSRGEREAAAVANQLTAWADRELSLAPDQRQMVGEVLTSGPGNEWLSSQALLRLDQDEFASFIRRLRVDPQAFDGRLSPSQAKVWRLMMTETNQRRNRANSSLQEHEALEERFEAVQAKLAAHTEQLGELNARASKRLALAAKGVAERSREAQDSGQLTLSQGGWNEARRQAAPRDITDYPIYQQTIKDVLSEVAYVEYLENQAERGAFWEQATRDVALACMDTRLLPGEQLRNRLEAAVTKLPVDANEPAGAVFAKLAGEMDRAKLSEWQIETLNGILQELGLGAGR